MCPLASYKLSSHFFCLTQKHHTVLFKKMLRMPGKAPIRPERPVAAWKRRKEKGPHSLVSGGCQVGEMGGGGQKVQASGCKVSKSCGVVYSMVTTIRHTLLYT